MSTPPPFGNPSNEDKPSLHKGPPDYSNPTPVNPYSPAPPSTPNFGPAPQVPYSNFNGGGNNPGGMVKPDNYLVWAILATLLCCLPAGVVSIIFATKVDTLWAQGQWNEAISASNSAKQWAIISAVAAVIVIAFYVVVTLVAAV